MCSRSRTTMLTALALALLLSVWGCQSKTPEQIAAGKLAEMEEQVAALQEELDKGAGELDEAHRQRLQQQLASMEVQLAETRKEVEEARSNRTAESEGETSTEAEGLLTPDPAPPPPQPEPATVTLESGTPLVIRTTTTMSTKTAQTGQQFYASLEEDLVADGWVIARKGATVKGVIAESSKGTKGKNDARLVLRLSSLAIDDGQEVEITTQTVSQQAPKTRKKKVAKVGIASGVGAAIGAIAGGGKGAAIGAGAGAGAGAGSILLTFGPPAVIDAESVLNFRLATPAEITQRR